MMLETTEEERTRREIEIERMTEGTEIEEEMVIGRGMRKGTKRERETRTSIEIETEREGIETGIGGTGERTGTGIGGIRTKVQQVKNIIILMRNLKKQERRNTEGSVLRIRR